MKVSYFIQSGKPSEQPRIVSDSTLKTALQDFEISIIKSQAQGSDYWRGASLVVDSEKGVRKYKVGSRGGVFQSKIQW